MNGFFGVFARSGATVDPAHLAAMGDAIPWCGRDGRGSWHETPIGLGHLAQWGTPEARFEQQPVVVDDGRLALVGEFRVDNRAELVARLALEPRAADRPITDAEVILAAYARWGADCGVHLIGDYAFAVWDRAANAVTCVRDAIGPVPLFYTVSSQWFVFANDLRALVAHPAVRDRLNETAVAHHLRWPQYILPDTTFIQDVQKLQAGRALVVDAMRERLHTFWTPADVASVQFADEAEYVARFNELFDAAVEDRLRSVRPVAAHVSGGLDSTSIAAAARRLLGARGESLAAAYHWLPTLGEGDDPDPAEYTPVRHAEDFLGMPIENVDLAPDYMAGELARDVALEGYSNLWYEPLVRAKARRHNVGVILSGWGGDEVVTAGGKGYYAEVLRRGKWARLARLLRGPTGTARRSYGRMAKMFWREALRPNLPDALVGWRAGEDSALLPHLFLSRDFGPKVAGVEPTFPSLRATSLHAVQGQRLTMGSLQARMEVWAVQGAQDGIRYAYPMLDRRLVEFCLGAPSDLLVQEEIVRGFFRRTQQGRLPDELRMYNAKYEPVRVERLMTVLPQALDQWWRSVQKDPARVAELREAGVRFLDWAGLTQALDEVGVAPAKSGTFTNDAYGAKLALYRQVHCLLMATRHS